MMNCDHIRMPSYQHFRAKPSLSQYICWTHSKKSLPAFSSVYQNYSLSKNYETIGTKFQNVSKLKAAPSICGTKSFYMLDFEVKNS